MSGGVVGSGGMVGNPGTEVGVKTAAALRVADRPGTGKAGRAVQLLANLFEVGLGGKVQVHKYHIDVLHPSKTRKLIPTENRDVWWEAVAVHGLGTVEELAYDGGHLVYALNKLTMPGGGDEGLLEVALHLSRDSKAQTVCRLEAKYVGPVLLNDLAVSRVSSQGGDILAGPIQAIDVIFRQLLTNQANPRTQHLAMRFFTFKEKAFEIPCANGVAQPVDLGKAVQMWLGFHSSAVVCDGPRGARALLNVDVAHSAFHRHGISFEAYLATVLGARSPNLPAQISQRDIQLANRYMKGQGIRVRTNHTAIVRSYRVLELSQQDATQMSFTVTDAQGNVLQTLTIAQYFANKYAPLKYPKLPLLQVAPMKKNILLPIEIVDLDTPLKYVKKLNDQQVSLVVKAAAVDAPTRKKRIETLMQRAGMFQDPYTAAFGMSLSQSMVKATGRVLAAPDIRYAGAGRAALASPKDGVWRTDRKNLLNTPTLNEYSMIATVPQTNQAALVTFCRDLHQQAGQMGWTIPQMPRFVEYTQGPTGIANAFAKIHQQYTAASVKCGLIVVVLPGKDADLYIAAKTASETAAGTGTMSQCVLLNTCRKINPTTCMNILFKLCAKLGGTPHTVQPVPQVLGTSPQTLVVGVDVSHPMRDEAEQGLPSVASVVGSLDHQAMRYGASVKVQRKAQEAVVYLVDVMKERLLSFYKATGAKPTQILVLRDGIAEGQFQDIVKEEVAGIREACMSLAADFKPLITFVVVQKRHHVRLFNANPRDAVGKAKNVAPGTVVDTDIVTPDAWDFFLCSHFGIQGTSRPAKYFVLLDEINFSADQLQQTVYSLCHNFVRCPRSVSIPAPVYYAHLVAARARAQLNRLLRLGSSGGASATSSSPATSTDALQDQLKDHHDIHNTMYFT